MSDLGIFIVLVCVVGFIRVLFWVFQKPKTKIEKQVKRLNKDVKKLQKKLLRRKR